MVSPPPPPPPAAPTPTGRIEHLAELGRAGVYTLMVTAFAVGASIWPFAHLDYRPLLWRNGLEWDDRVSAAWWTGLGTVVVAGLLAGWVAVRYRRVGGGLAAAISAVRDRTLWGLGAPLLVFLTVETIERKYPFLTLALAVGVAVALAISVYRVRTLAPPSRRQARVLSALTWIIGIVIAAQMIDLAVTNHLAFNTQTADLGYYDNLFYQSLHGRPLGVSMMKSGVHYSGHFDPFLLLFTPLYALAPNATTLMGLQIVWLALGAWPAYRIVLRATDRPTWAAALALVYLLYPAMHGVAMFEFHSLAMALPLLLWLMDCLQRRAWKTFYVFVVLLWLVREDLPLVLCFVGASIILSEEGARRHGLALIVGSIAYFVVVKKFVMVSDDMLNCSAGGACFNYYFEDLIPDDEGVKDILLSLVSNPGFAVRHAFDEPKVLFLAHLFLPLALLPLVARKGRFMLLYGLAFTLLASNTAVFTIYFQYSVVLFPLAFAVTAYGLAEVAHGRLSWLRLDPQRLGNALVVGMLAFTVLASWKFGVLVDNDAFRVGYRRPIREVTEEDQAARAWLLAEVAKLPDEARIAVSRNLGPHISNREHVLRFPGQDGAEYIVLRERDLKKAEKRRWRKFRTSAKLDQVARRKDVGIYAVPNAKRWEWPKEEWR